VLVKTAASIDHKHHKKTLEHHTSTFQKEVGIRYTLLILYEKVDINSLLWYVNGVVKELQIAE